MRGRLQCYYSLLSLLTSAIATECSCSTLSSWGIMDDDDVGDSNKRTILKWEQEEEMGDLATISRVLYVNMCHPDLKQKYPDWSERSKQIAKLWRKLTPDEKAPYLSKARMNRTSC